MKLNDKTVKGLKPKAEKYYIHGDMSNDRHGFAICVYPASTKYPAGTKSWFFIYRYEGKRCFMPLGKYPTMGLADAAKEFEKHWTIFATGKNPATVKEDEQVALDAAPTVKTLVADYIERYAKVNKKSWMEDQRILEKEILGMKAEGQRQEGAVDWSRRKAADITKRDVIVLLDKIVDRGSPQTACNVFKILRKMFNWAIKKDILEVSPCDRVDMPAPLVAKDRALDAEEIKTLWNSLDSKAISMVGEVRQMLKLILITAQRPAEVSGIHTSEIDGSWWNIPAERAKNGKAHRVYLSGLAMGIIAEAIAGAKDAREKAEKRNARETNRKAILTPEDQEYCGFIFPCPRRFEGKDKGRGKVPDKPIERHAMSKALLRNESPDDKTTLGVATWTPHDLRRTAATQMSELGFMDEIIDAVLNHSKTGVIATYNRNRYDREKQASLESWERRLISITTEKDMSNVYSIQSSKAA